MDLQLGGLKWVAFVLMIPCPIDWSHCVELVAHTEISGGLSVFLALDP